LVLKTLEHLEHSWFRASLCRMLTCSSSCEGEANDLGHLMHWWRRRGEGDVVVVGAVWNVVEAAAGEVCTGVGTEEYNSLSRKSNCPSPAALAADSSSLMGDGGKTTVAGGEGESG
jgi:hypothetical protein